MLERLLRFFRARGKGGLGWQTCGRRLRASRIARAFAPAALALAAALGHGRLGTALRRDLGLSAEVVALGYHFATMARCIVLELTQARDVGGLDEGRAVFPKGINRSCAGRCRCQVSSEGQRQILATPDPLGRFEEASIRFPSRALCFRAFDIWLWLSVETEVLDERLDEGPTENEPGS